MKLSVSQHSTQGIKLPRHKSGACIFGRGASRRSIESVWLCLVVLGPMSGSGKMMDPGLAHVWLFRSRSPVGMW